MRLYPSLIISTKDPSTFDPELQAIFDANRGLIKAYHQRDAELGADRRAGGIRYITDPNPVADGYMRFREDLGRHLQSRTVRCWHYTRLTEDELAHIRAHGVVPGTIESMEGRIARQIAAGRLSEADAAAIVAASPLRHPEQAQARLGMFWVTDRPLHPSDLGVQPLLAHWGGEVVYFYLQDEAQIARIQGLGTPTVLELAVPVASTMHAFSFGESALSSVVAELGYPPQLSGIDAFLTQPLGAAGLIAVHTPAAPTFNTLGVASCA